MTCGMPGMSRTWKCQIFPSSWKTMCSFCWHFCCLKFLGDWLIRQFVCLSTPADCTETSDVRPQKFFHLQRSGGGKSTEKGETMFKKENNYPRTWEQDQRYITQRCLLCWNDFSVGLMGQSLNGIVLKHTACCRWRLTLVDNIFIKSAFSSKNNILQPSVTVCTVRFGKWRVSRLWVSSYDLLINSTF